MFHPQHIWSESEELCDIDIKPTWNYNMTLPQANFRVMAAEQLPKLQNKIGFEQIYRLAGAI